MIIELIALPSNFSDETLPGPVKARYLEKEKRLSGNKSRRGKNAFKSVEGQQSVKNKFL